MRIQHNITAMNSYRNYTANANKLSKNLEKLSSGYKINRAGDDAAGLAISEKMRSQITGLSAAQKNVKDGISLVKTAEGALQEVHDMLNRMTYLATQSANGTYDNSVDRPNLQKELDALRTEIDRIADASNFNGQKLLDGSLFSGTKATFTQAAGQSAAPMDATFVCGSFKSAGGTVKNFTFAFATAAASNASVAVTSAGAITVTLSKKVAEYSAGDLAKLVKDGVANASKATDEMKNAIKGLEVTGAGVKGCTDKIKAKAAPTVDAAYGKGTPLTLQIGDTADSFNMLQVGVKDMHSKALGIDTVDISTQEGAQAAVAAIKSAINSVSANRGDLGAFQNRLEHTNNNLAVMEENIQDAESTIRDTDVADEMTEYTKNNILLQSAQAMLAQANQMPQGVLQLLQ